MSRGVFPPAPDALGVDPALQPYAGPPLTVSGKLNKLVFNIGTKLEI
jgi:hypothetical protein